MQVWYAFSSLSHIFNAFIKGLWRQAMQNDSPPLTSFAALPIWVIDSFSVWSSLRIASTVPLGRLEWLWNSRGSSVRDSSTSARILFQISTSTETSIPPVADLEHHLFQNPYVYILVAVAKELDSTNDLAPVWQRIRRFVDSCREKYYEYLIILVASESELTQNRRAVDKLKSEVNLISRGRDRVVFLAPAGAKEEHRPITHLKLSPSHQELLLRLQECVRDSVESRIQQYEERVSRSYLNRSSKRWTFTSFFALKEGMAFVFVQLGRRDLAVKFYDELMSTMVEIGSQVSSFVTFPAAEVANAVLHPDGKDYRKSMIENSINEVDLRTYWLSRKIALLIGDRKISEGAECGLKFISQVVRRIDEEAAKPSSKISPVFRDTWIFVASRILAAALASAIPSHSDASHAMSTELSTPRERHTARLVAGFHVHVLKALLSLTQIFLPGCLGSSQKNAAPVSEAMVKEAKSTTNERLRTALSDPKAAEVLHSEIANAAASLYEMGGRPRGAAALDGDAGIIRLRNKSLSEAETLLNAQCTRFANDNGWDELHRRVRVQLAHAEKQLGRVQEYLVSCLTMLYMAKASRLQGVSSRNGELESDEEYPEDAYWIEEMTKTAARLPKVMKYKAGRLFRISVLPNESSWYEGDSGSAVLRIQSDLDADIVVDFIALECRPVELQAVQKSAFVDRDTQSPLLGAEDDTPSLKKMDSDSHQGPENSSSPSTDRAGTLIFKSARDIRIRPGSNDVVVNAKEVDVCGQYKVILVAMYLHNLKFVEAASKISSYRIVSSKRKGILRGMKDTATGTLPADISAYEVPFPLFYATKRKPAASVSVELGQRLYLAPNTIQYVSVGISANENGIAKGSQVQVSLHPHQDTVSGRSNTIIQLADPALCKEGSTSYMLRLKSSGSALDGFQKGNDAMESDFPAHRRCQTAIGLKLSEENWIFSEALLDTESEIRRWTMRVQFTCKELTGNTTRTFTCDTLQELILFSPVTISARVQLGCEWAENVLQNGKEQDSIFLGEGGTLLCLVESTAKGSDTIRLKQVTLQTPSWLEIRSDVTPPHDELMPCTVICGGTFVSVFDVFVKTGAELAKNSPDKLLSHEEKDRTGHDAGENVNAEGPVSDSRAANEVLATPLPGVNGGSEPSASVEQNNEEGQDIDITTVVETSNSEQLATLRIEMEIDGVDGSTWVDRKVSVSAFRARSRRYRVERAFDRVGQCGELMELRFKVRLVGGRRKAGVRTGEHILQYELNTDPTVWLLTGRRRSQLTVDEGGAEGAAVVMPLVCGSHLVPRLRLYTKEGDAMPFSRYANANEYMEVIIMPSKTLVSRCSARQSERKIYGPALVKANMPTIMPSDSFFSS